MTAIFNGFDSYFPSDIHGLDGGWISRNHRRSKYTRVFVLEKHFETVLIEPIRQNLKNNMSNQMTFLLVILNHL